MQQSQQQKGEQCGKGKSCQKSLVVLDIKPETLETDLGKLKSCIPDRIQMDGLCWGQSKEEQIGYGIKKLVFGCVIEDKVSIDDVIQQLQKMDDVQAVDIASFNKV